MKQKDTKENKQNFNSLKRLNRQTSGKIEQEVKK